MKFLRDNFAYLLLAVIAVLLIVVTLSLQVAIFSTQATAETESNRGLLYTLRQQLAALIQPATDTPVTSTTATVGQPVAPAVVLPTNTPNVIIVQPSPLPPTPTTLVIQATATADPATATLLPGAYNVSAVATRLAAPTVTSAQVVPPPASSTLAPTATSVALPASAAPPTNTPGVAADFRLGYVTSNPECAAVTALLQLILEQEFALRVVTIPFAEPTTLFAKLADKTEAERVDLSFCYVDPDDRSYLQKYFGFVIFIGSGYRQLNNQKFIIMSNAAVKSPIERGNPCLYRFLVNLNLNDVDLAAGDAAGWYQTHAEQVATWTRCE
jgi:hypothetical protein